MDIKIDVCHICLDKKVEINKLDVCGNKDCGGYICNKCWIDIYKNGIDKCPICYVELAEEQEYNKNKNYSFELSVDVKKMIYNILAYLSFYSIGSSTLLIILYMFGEIDRVKDNIDINYYIFSLIFIPIFGFIIWYIVLISLFNVIKCIKYDITYHDSDSDSDSDSDIENQ